jgi:hypothetical protein
MKGRRGRKRCRRGVDPGTKADHVIGVDREEFAVALEGRAPPPRV